jgi:hypothetical protein
MIARTPWAALLFLLAVSGTFCGLLSAGEPPTSNRSTTQLQAELKALSEERRQLALATFERLFKDFDGWREAEKVLASANRLLDAELAVSDNPAHHVAVLERHAELRKTMKVREQATFESGRIPLSDYESRFAYPVKDTMLRLHDAKRRLGK